MFELHYEILNISLSFVLQNCKGALRMGTLIKNWALEHDILRWPKELHDH